MSANFRVVGLTGGIATGKSSVARFLREQGVPVIDADQVARDVVRPGEPALAEIVAVFGPQTLDAQGELDRRAMRARIGADPQARQQLERITHPRIRQRMGEQIVALAGSGHPAVVVEAALLVETGSYRDYPVLIVVTCSGERQLARVMARDGASEAEARQLIATQLPMAEKERVASHVIRNDGGLEELQVRTREVWAAVLAG